jgi:SAM-dependent methyltransferase
LHHVLSLGETPLANALLTAEQVGQAERRYPLDLAFCPACTLVQITETVAPEALFSEYLYFSSFSDTMLRHASALVERIMTMRHLGPSSLVVELASNDGYLLQYYREHSIPVLGIEPARNVARVAIERGIPTVCEFFGESVADQLRATGQLANVIHANNVLAHVPDLNGVVRGIGRLLKVDGTAVIEVPYVKEMIDQREFDTIYHEHLCYFSLTALDRLFRRHGLLIHDVERVPIHGGSLRVWASPTGSGGLVQSPAVVSLLAEEETWGVGRSEFYDGFGQSVERLRLDLLSLLRTLRGSGQRIAVYGASAKGSTLLNYFGIGGDSLEFVVDRSTAKQGRFTPGSHLPIYPPEKLLEAMPDYVLLLTWNFEDEILAQQDEFIRRGGRFIVPIPEVRIVPESGHRPLSPLSRRG